MRFLTTSFYSALCTVTASFLLLSRAFKITAAASCSRACSIPYSIRVIIWSKVCSGSLGLTLSKELLRVISTWLMLYYDGDTSILLSCSIYDCEVSSLSLNDIFCDEGTIAVLVSSMSSIPSLSRSLGGGLGSRTET